MARVSIELIEALKKTSLRIQTSPDYQWGHMGLCNCGFLAQEVTSLTKEQIHRTAMERYGDWNEQLNDYCSTSGLAMDDIISSLVNFGFTIDELKHLERLSKREVLERIPIEQRNLKQNVKVDVLTYFSSWIALLEEELIGAISLKDISLKEPVGV